MHGAGKRLTRPPDRYDPLNYISSPLLPVTDFDLTMASADNIDNSLSQISPLSLVSLEQKINDMAESFNVQLDNVSRKFAEIDTRIDELCTRIDDNDTDTGTKLNQLQTSFNQDLINTQNELSRQQQRIQESQKNTTATHHNIQDTVQALTDRISLVEGQAARLSALENKIQKNNFLTTSLTPIQLNTQTAPRVSFSKILTSTTMSNLCPLQTSIPLNTSSIPVPSYNNTLVSNITSPYTNSTISTTTSISLDSTKISTYDGNLSPVHPEEFLEQAEQYFLTQPPVPDQVKINYIKSKFVDGARLWYNTLLPPPSVYANFLTLFRNHFWSNNQQRAIRNDLYRPYFHRDNTSLQKHAMDWISQARFLQPPIDQVEMVDQIISHFSFNISIALRGLRITTTNELVQQLSHIQQAHSPSNSSNNNSLNNSQQQNSYHQSSGPPSTNRYPSRQNHYNRNQYSNNNNAPPPQQLTDPSVPPPGNSA